MVLDALLCDRKVNSAQWWKGALRVRKMGLATRMRYHQAGGNQMWRERSWGCGIANIRVEAEGLIERDQGCLWVTCKY